MFLEASSRRRDAEQAASACPPFLNGARLICSKVKSRLCSESVLHKRARAGKGNLDNRQVRQRERERDTRGKLVCKRPSNCLRPVTCQVYRNHVFCMRINISNVSIRRKPDPPVISWRDIEFQSILPN